MTAQEIDSIIRMQQMLHYLRPQFVDDYYFLVKTAGSREAVGPHRPVCDNSLDPREEKRMEKRAKQEDPFKNVLGRIPSHSVRAPRPLVSLDANKEPELPTNLDKKTTENVLNIRAYRRLLLRIEDAWGTLLCIEDLDILAQDPKAQNKKYLNKDYMIEKRKELAITLFKQLGIARTTPPPPSEPSSQFFATEQDKPFISIFTTAKGRKLLGRVLRVMYPQQILLFILACCRNLSTIVHTPKDAQDDENLSRAFAVVMHIVNMLQPTQILMCLHSMVTHHDESKLIRAIKSKIGAAVIWGFLKRAYTDRRDPSFMQSFDPLFAALSNKLVRSLSRLFNSQITQGYSNDARSTQIWEFLLVFTAHSNPEQRQYISMQLRSILLSVVQPAPPAVQQLKHLLNVV